MLSPEELAREKIELAAMNVSREARVVPLREIATVAAGYSPRSDERKKSGKYILLGGRNIKDGRLARTAKDSYIDDIPNRSFQRAIAQVGDVIVSTLFDRRKLYIYQKDDPPAVVNSSCAIVRAPETNDYIISYLRTLQGERQFLKDAAEATRRTFIPHLSISSIAAIQIPLLPLAELQRLGDEHIRSSANAELIQLRGELKAQLSTPSVADEATLQDVMVYFENRIQRIEAQISDNNLGSRIAHGETPKLEFKSSVRRNLKANRDDPEMGLAILKTIAAFCNTEGGELLIGVSDDGRILGIEHDHFENSDKFLLHLRNLITGKLIPSVIQYVTYEIVHIDGKEICHVVCKPSKADIWVKPDSTRELFFVRTGPSSTELQPREATRYIRDHFNA
jgi:hypothetical protein